MPETSHTPGPWRACRDGACDCGNVFGPPVPEIGGETPLVAIVCGPMHTDYGDIVPKREQQAANIRLIAAAPDLLEACEAALKRLEELEPRVHPHGVPSPGTISKLRAAIAKARGGTTGAGD